MKRLMVFGFLMCAAVMALAGCTRSTAPEPVTVTATVSQQQSTSTTPPTVTTTATTTAAPPPAPAPPQQGQPPQAQPQSSQCDSSVGVGSSSTSCPFAAAVRDAYLNSGGKGQARTVTAVSPVTGQAYSMACGPEGTAVVCRGGAGAVVVIY